MSNFHGPPPAHNTHDPYGQNRNSDGTHRAALIIQTIADIAAGFLALWLLLYMLDANEGNSFVGFVHDVASWLAGWSQDIFTMETEGLRVFLNYALPAGIYLLLGHGIAARMRRA